MAHALVTGANRGLGLAFVRALLARGDRVVAACRQPGRATALNAEAGEHPGRLHLLPLDVARPQSIEECARELPLVAESLDLVVHCAGVLHSGERFGELQATLVEDAFRVNALGPLLLTQALAERLAEDAKVVAMASEIGSIARVEAFRTPGYAISKAALNMVVAQLAKALAPRGIVVAGISPGWVATDMGGVKAPVGPAEAVAQVLDTIGALDMGRSGAFLDRSGEALPW